MGELEGQAEKVALLKCALWSTSKDGAIPISYADDVDRPMGLARIIEIERQRAWLAAWTESRRQERSMVLAEACLIVAKVSEDWMRLKKSKYRDGGDAVCEEIIVRLQDEGACVPTRLLTRRRGNG